MSSNNAARSLHTHTTTMLDRQSLPGYTRIPAIVNSAHGRPSPSINALPLRLPAAVYSSSSLGDLQARNSGSSSTTPFCSSTTLSPSRRRESRNPLATSTRRYVISDSPWNVLKQPSVIMVTSALRNEIPEFESRAFIVPRGVYSESSPVWKRNLFMDTALPFQHPDGWNKEKRELLRGRWRKDILTLGKEDQKVLRALLPDTTLCVVSGSTSKLLRTILTICDPRCLSTRPDVTSVNEDVWHALYRIASVYYIEPVLKLLLKAMERLARSDPLGWFNFCFDEGWEDGMKTCLQVSFAPLAARQLLKSVHGSSTRSRAEVTWERLHPTYLAACVEELGEGFLIISAKADKAGVYHAPGIEPSTANSVFFTCEHHNNMNRTRQRLRIRGGQTVHAHAWFIKALRRLQDCLRKCPSARTVRDFSELLDSCDTCRICESSARRQVISLMKDLAERVSKRLEKVSYLQRHICHHIC